MNHMQHEKSSTKDALELEKLQHELAEVRRPWLLRLAAPALLAALASGAGGYLFGDSLAARNRAELRKDVMNRYWSVPNDVAGKRRQILNFVMATLAKDDPDLGQWALREQEVVDQRLHELALEQRALEDELERLQAPREKQPPLGAERGRPPLESRSQPASRVNGRDRAPTSSGRAPLRFDRSKRARRTELVPPRREVHDARLASTEHVSTATGSGQRPAQEARRGADRPSSRHGIDSRREPGNSAAIDAVQARLDRAKANQKADDPAGR